MDPRNSKGQILLEAVFLVAAVIGILVLFQALIERHRIEMKKNKFSIEQNRTYYQKDKFPNETHANQPTK